MRPTRFALRRYGNVVVAIVAIATLSIGLSSCGTSTNTQFAPAHPGHPMGYRVIVFAVNTVSLDVSAVDAATGKIIRTIPVGRFSYAMATSPNGEWGYVADTDWGGTPGFTMIPVNLVTWKVGKPIRVGMGPFAIAITPNGKWAYVADMGKMTAEFANQPPSANP
ncbi:MAG: YncE family protein, partial [Actinomycetota bacterium]|nr:YncE family protein [Actinomycetota bacterium]